jgi:hypothetical protein
VNLHSKDFLVSIGAQHKAELSSLPARTKLMPLWYKKRTKAKSCLSSCHFPAYCELMQRFSQKRITNNPFEQFMDNRNNPKKYTCNEYRQEMILASLLKQLTRTDLSQEERRQLEKEILKKEKEIGL